MKIKLPPMFLHGQRPSLIAMMLMMLQLTPTIGLTGILDFETSWVGNSFQGGKHGSMGQGKWVPNNNRDMHVTADGTLYLTVPWEEGGATLSQINSNGEVVDYANGAFGWGYSGGNAVTANNTFVYFGQRMTNEGASSKTGAPPQGRVWYGIDRRDRANIDQGTPIRYTQKRLPT